MALLYLLVARLQDGGPHPRLNRGHPERSVGRFKHISAPWREHAPCCGLCGRSHALIVGPPCGLAAELPQSLPGIAPRLLSKQADMVVLIGALGSVFWGYVVDRITVRPSPQQASPALAVLCVATAVIFLAASQGTPPGPAQFKLVLLGGFFMTCTVGRVSGWSST